MGGLCDTYVEVNKFRCWMVSPRGKRMSHPTLYFLLVLIPILAVLRGRAGVMEFRVKKYIQENCPEKAKDYGCEKDGWFNEFKLVWALYKNKSIQDPDFIRLRDKAKSAQSLGFLMLALGSLLLIGFVLVRAFWG